MEYKSSYDRIGGVSDIESISKRICADYGFGEYNGWELIETGYEDFNYYLYTKDKTYVVKIFNIDREDSSCYRLIDILSKSIKNGIPVPKIYKQQDKYVYDITIGETPLKLFVMDHVGVDFWSLNRPLNNQELGEVAKIAAHINKIDYGIDEPFYDEWAVTNLTSEFTKKHDSLSNVDYPLVHKIVTNFSKLDITELMHSYIHGDMIKANLLLDEKNNMHVIDFSGFNYLPRIVEVTAIICGLCLTDDKETTIEKINFFISEYNKHYHLNQKELENLPLFINALAAMYVIQSSFIRSNGGDYTENDYWYNEGIKCLKMNINSKDIKITK